MVSTERCLETGVIIVVLCLIQRSTPDEILQNVTSTPQDSSSQPHYGNIDKDYHNIEDQEISNDGESLNVEKSPVGSQNGGTYTEHNKMFRINNQTIDQNETINNSVDVRNEVNVSSKAIKDQVNYSDGVQGAINSTTHNSFVEAGNGVKDVKVSDNDSQKDNLELLNGTADNTGCGAGNASSPCDNSTDSNRTQVKLIDPLDKIEKPNKIVPSGTSVQSTEPNPSIGSKNSMFLIDNSSEDRDHSEEVTTEATIVTQILKDLEKDNENILDKGPEDKIDLSNDRSFQSQTTSDVNDVTRSSDVKSFTSTTSGQITSTNAFNFSSFLLSAETSIDGKKLPSGKDGSAHKGSVPDFTKSNGYPPHAIHGLIWEDRRYLLSVLIPVGCGILGALTMVSLAYAARNCRSKYSYYPPSMPITPDDVAYMDKIMLIPDSSDDEV